MSDEKDSTVPQDRRAMALYVDGFRFNDRAFAGSRHDWARALELLPKMTAVALVLRWTERAWGLVVASPIPEGEVGGHRYDHRPGKLLSLLHGLIKWPNPKAFEELAQCEDEVMSLGRQSIRAGNRDRLFRIGCYMLGYLGEGARERDATMLTCALDEAVHIIKEIEGTPEDATRRAWRTELVRVLESSEVMS